MGARNTPAPTLYHPLFIYQLLFLSSLIYFSLLIFYTPQLPLNSNLQTQAFPSEPIFAQKWAFLPRNEKIYMFFGEKLAGMKNPSYLCNANERNGAFVQGLGHMPLTHGTRVRFPQALHPPLEIPFIRNGISFFFTYMHHEPELALYRITWEKEIPK